jgi:hypothetical protein
MNAQILTTEEIRNCDGRNYNPQTWENKINKMVENYKDVVFYFVPKCEIYHYDRYFVEYTLPEGLRLFSSFGYSGSITNGGFYRLDKSAKTEDGRNFTDLLELFKADKKEEAEKLMAELSETKFLDISYGTFTCEKTGEQVLFGTTNEARKSMIERSVKYGVAFTKG